MYIYIYIYIWWTSSKPGSTAIAEDQRGQPQSFRG